MALDKAITNLHQMVEAHFAIHEPDVKVFDGQPVEDAPQECVLIGTDAEDLATDGTISVVGLDVQEENFDINCLIKCWSGDTDLVELRTRAVTLYESVKELVKSDHKLKGATTWARVASVQYSPMRLPDGSVVNMAFRVRCRTLSS